MALEAGKRSGKKILVFGPAFLRGVWAKEAEIMGVEIMYIPYSMVHKVKPSDVAPFDFWIADEVHFAKTPTEYFKACEAEGWKKCECFRCCRIFYHDLGGTEGSDEAKDINLQSGGGELRWSEENEDICQECLDEYEDKVTNG